MFATTGIKKQGDVTEVISVALPMVVSLSCDTVMVFTDRLFLSRIGAEQMNAAMGGGLAAFVVQTLFLGIIGYSTAMVAQEYGAQRKERCSLVVTQALGIALLAWPLMMLLAPLGAMIFPALGLPVGQVKDQSDYFSLLVLGSGVGLVRSAFSGFFSGLGKTKIVMIASLITMVANIGLNWILVFGNLGFPALGIKGAAYGTILAGAIGVCILAYSYMTAENRRHFAIAKSWRFDASVFRTLFYKGIPAGMEMFLNVLAFQFMVMLFHRQGEASATAATIMFNWDMVSFVPLVGIEIGITSLVGRYIGARQPAAVRRSVTSGMKLGWVFSIFVLVAFLFFPEPLVDLFQPQTYDATFATARPLAVGMVRLASIYILIEAVMLAYAGALRGAGDTWWTMWAMVSLHWTLVAFLWFSLEYMQWGTLASWGMLVGMFMLFPILLGWRWRRGNWRKAMEQFAPSNSLP